MADKLREVIEELLGCKELNPKKVCRETEKTIAWARVAIVDKPKAKPKKKKPTKGICHNCKKERVIKDAETGLCSKCFKEHTEAQSKPFPSV